MFIPVSLINQVFLIRSFTLYRHAQLGLTRVVLDSGDSRK